VVERIKIQSNRILTKNASGDPTFDSDRLYLKTVSSGNFSAGGLRQISCPRGIAVGSTQLGNIVADSRAGLSLIEGGANLVPNPNGSRVAYNFGLTSSFPSGSYTPSSYKIASSARKFTLPRGSDQLEFVNAHRLGVSPVTVQRHSLEPHIPDPACTSAFCGMTAWQPEVGDLTSSSLSHDNCKKYYSNMGSLTVVKQLTATTTVPVGNATPYLRRRMGHYSSAYASNPAYTIADGFYVYLTFTSINWEHAAYYVLFPNPRSYNWHTLQANQSLQTSQNTIVHAQNWFWWAPEMVFAGGDPVNLDLVVTP
jgi:hypothetical protein